MTPLQFSLDAFGALVGTVGFPVAAFLLLYKMLETTLKDLNGSIEELEDEISDLDKTLQADVLTRISGQTGIDHERVEEWIESGEKRKNREN